MLVLLDLHARFVVLPHQAFEMFQKIKYIKFVRVVEKYFRKLNYMCKGDQSFEEI